MGTRNLIAVFMDGEYRVAQYAQWDGYPEGQGRSVLEFLQCKALVKALKEKLSAVRFLDREGKDKGFIEEYSKNAPEWSNEPDHRTADLIRWFTTYMSRDLGAQILNNIATSIDSEIIIDNSLKFAGDSLFCEWCYVVDFDNKTFEIFEGFNKDRIEKGRFTSDDEPLEKTEKYEPVKLAKLYWLDDLPTVKEFIEYFQLRQQALEENEG